MKDNHDLNFYFNVKNIPNQDLVFETYNFFNKGAGKNMFLPIDFLNILNWHYNFLVSNIELPFHFLKQINNQNYSILELQTLKGFLLKWFGGYPVNNLNPQFNTALKLIEEEYLETLNLNKDPLNLDENKEYLELLDNEISNKKHIVNENSIINKSEDEISVAQPIKHFSIFISHSNKDSDIVKLFVDKILRLSLGLNLKDIFCTSIEAYSIKTGDDFRKVLKNELSKASIVIQFITPNYKESEVCLNEMGAAWILSNKVVPFILSPIDYESIGFIHSVNQVLKLEEQTDILKFIDEMKLKRKDIQLTELIRHVNDFTTAVKYSIKEKLIEKYPLEVEAEFNGDWLKYLRENLNGEVPVKNGASAGTYQVMVNFIINKYGEITDANTSTNLGYGMEQEALRVIKSSPNWKPAIQYDRPVNAYRRQPITFIVEEAD